MPESGARKPIGSGMKKWIWGGGQDPLFIVRF